MKREVLIDKISPSDFLQYLSLVPVFSNFLYHLITSWIIIKFVCYELNRFSWGQVEIFLFVSVVTERIKDAA